MPNLLGLDIGTTSIKAVLLDSEIGRIISSASLPTPLIKTGTYQDEHDPIELFNTAAICIRKAVGDNVVHALSISSFAEAGLPLDKSGNPLFPVIAWYDQRSRHQAEKILESFSEEKLFSITGQKVSYSFGIFKYLWIKEHFPHLVQNMNYWVSVPDFLLFCLTGQIVTDFTQASRTMLFDQGSKTWSDEILSYAGLDINNLPRLLPSGSVMGAVTREASEITGLPVNTPCVLGGHDHLCGAFASGGAAVGKIIESSGTACAVMVLADQFNSNSRLIDDGYVNYIYVVPDIYVIKGGLKTAGKAVDWLSKLLNNEDLFKYDMLAKHYNPEVFSRPLWLPFFLGSGTPDVDPFSRGSLIGLTLNHSKEEIAIALCEGLGFWLRENIERIKALVSLNPNQVIAIGGTNQNPLLRQIKASITGLTISASEVPEASAVGAALLAAVGIGAVPSYEKAPEILNYSTHEIHPDDSWKERYTNIYQNVYLPAKFQLANIISNLREII